MAWPCTAANGTDFLVFLDVTTDKSSRMNSEVCRTILPAHIQPNASKQYLAYCKSNPTIFLRQMSRILMQCPSQSSNFNTIEPAFHLLKGKLKAKCSKNK